MACGRLLFLPGPLRLAGTKNGNTPPGSRQPGRDLKRREKPAEFLQNVKVDIVSDLIMWYDLDWS